MNHRQPNAGRNLTLLYCMHQSVYYFAIAGVGAFAVTYLLGRGFDTASIGVMLAASNILSCILQPAIGAYVDRTSVARLQTLIPASLTASFAMLGALELIPMPKLLEGLCYIFGYLTFSITMPLCNSLCAYYSRKGSHVNYGAGLGVGSVFFSFGSLAFGYVIAQLGATAMIVFVLLLLVVQLVLVMRYPRVQPEAPSGAAQGRTDSLSMAAFLGRYKLFVLTMTGVAFLAACHAMSENFLIQIFTRIGGGSENVGVALFLACITAAPAQLYFERIQRRLSAVLLLRISGVFFMLKVILLIFAKTVPSVYTIFLLQTFTYGFLYPPLYYLVLQRIDVKDMAKGQTLASAMFSLGMAMGNLLGGVAVENWGLNPMLALAAVIACAGTLLVNVTVRRKEA